MQEELRIRARVVEESVMVDVAGEIDVTCASQLRDALGEAMATAGTSVDVDLSEVTYFGAAGANVLVRAYHDASVRSLDLRVTVGSPPVEKVLAATGLAFLFGVLEGGPDP